MERFKWDWESGTTPNSKVSWLGFVLRLIAHALFLPRIFDVQCSRFFTLTSSIAKSMAQFKCWPSPIIVASQAIGWLGFNCLIDPTFAGHRQR
ncbi:hypothetical protein M2244_004179 [Rhodoferax antarcticus]|nr:hypothetical protein [Rhodoferax antarcticus]